MAKDCTQIDELMMDFLYQELAGDELTSFRKHVDSCERCTHELARFQGVRSAARVLTEAEPPVAVSARLLSEAAEAVKPSAVKRAWVWLAGAFAPMRAHPALAAATALVVIVGVGGMLLRRGYRGESAEKTVSFDDRVAEHQGAPSPVATPTAPEPAAAAQTPSLDLQLGAGEGGQMYGDTTTAAPAETEADKERYARLRKEDQAAHDRGLAKNGRADDDRKLEAAQGGADDGARAEEKAEGFARPPADMASREQDNDGVLAESEAPAPEWRAPTTPKPASATRSAPTGGTSVPMPTGAAPGGASPDFAQPPPASAPAPMAGRGGGGSATSTGSAGGEARPAPPTVATTTPATGGKTAQSKGGTKSTTAPTKKAAEPSKDAKAAPQKPTTPQQLQALADSRRRQGNCMGALYLYDEILRKFPTYGGRKTVSASRDKCVADLTGKANRKSGGSAGTSKAKAAPAADEAAEPSSVKLSGD